MTEDTHSVTQDLKKLEAQHGDTLVVLALLKKYWGRITGLVAAVLAAGVFWQQFQDMKTALSSVGGKLDTQQTQLAALAMDLRAVKDKQIEEESRWKTVTTEAAIVIKRKDEPRKK